jgi:RNA polymerase sigma factor (TIGR02999 family)
MESHDVTRLLLASRSGDDGALDRLFPRVYDELKVIARQRLGRHGRGHTLHTTALVHETYLRLVDQTRVEVTDRSHFFALASRAMRFILIDHARARTAAKRGGDAEPVPIDDVQVAVEGEAIELLDLNAALERLADRDERLAELVDYRFFGGMTHEEVAEVTGRSVPTVKRDWRRARAWLYAEMKAGETPGDAEDAGSGPGSHEPR